MSNLQVLVMIIVLICSAVSAALTMLLSLGRDRMLKSYWVSMVVFGTMVVWAEQ